jgi:hypothetical protein
MDMTIQQAMQVAADLEERGCLNEPAKAARVLLAHINSLASPQVTDEQIAVPRDRIEELLEYSDKEYVPNALFAEFRALLSAPPAAETPEVPYNLRTQFEKFMVLWSEHLYGAPVDTDKKQDEDLGLTYKSQFMAGAWFIWQSVAAGSVKLPEGCLPMLPAASKFVHGYSESQVIEFAGKVLAITSGAGNSFDGDPPEGSSQAKWREMAREYSNSSDFYRGIVVQIGEMFGEAARTSDDGSIQSGVLALKVPELVKAALAPAASQENMKNG